MYHFPIKWFSSGLTEPADYKVICWQIFNFIPSWPADYKVICWQIFNFIPSWIMTTRQASSQTHFLGCYFLNDIGVWLRSFLTTKAHYPYWCLMDWCHILMPTSQIYMLQLQHHFCGFWCVCLPQISALSSCLCAWLYVLPELPHCAGGDCSGCQYGTQEDDEHPHMKACLQDQQPSTVQSLLKRAQPTQGNQRTPARRQLGSHSPCLVPQPGM